MKVLKFGGSSVGNVERIREVMDIIAASKEKNGRIAVVFSAFQGVTDSLITIGTTATTGGTGYVKALEELRERHLQVVNELIGVKERSRVLSRVMVEFRGLADIVHGVSLTGEVTARCMDSITSYGERLSAYIICEALIQRGVDARFTDSRGLIIANGSFGAGLVDFEVTNRNIREHFLGNGQVNIITGFIASAPNGETITLGRGGSDYTASIIGAAMEVAEIEIWTDVDGVMSADPRKVKEAFPIESLSYEEAMEMSHFGAKVIYPPTMLPAMERGIPIRIMNTLNPGFKGSLIGKRNGDEMFEIKGISSIDRIAVLLIQGSGMVGVTGISKRIFTALAQVDVNVVLISQASSEHSVCIAVMPEDAVKACESLNYEFRFEIQMGLVNEVSVQESLSIITVVGSQMKNTPGSAGKLFGALGANRINIVAIAQGSSELNISAVIESRDLERALRVIHNSYFGVGLPVIGPLRDLMLCGDSVVEIEGVFSGTLSYIFNSYDGSVPFSALVKRAMEMGYTEPDPRDDLNGKDVARKLLILAREAGYRIEPENIVVESLIPEGVPSSGGVEEFFVEMEQRDSLFERRLEIARNSGRVLRYIARFSGGKASVSLVDVDSSSPFYNLKSSDNMISFKTRYYSERPVVIQGPGAGAVVTACGVLSDIIKTGLKRYEN